MSSVATLVAQYRRQYRVDPETADRSLLERGRVLLEAHRQETTLAPEIVHAGFDLLDRTGETPAGLSLLRQYLGQSLTPDERAWAWWHVIDSLAGQHQCDEVVREQTALWQWAIRDLDGYRLNLSAGFPYHPSGLDTAPSGDSGETIAPEIMRLWVMHDGTQAKCWVDASEGEAWLQLAQEALAATPPTLHNRHQRFNFLRTLALVAAWSGQFEAGLSAAEHITALADEETDWEMQQRWRIDGLYVTMRVRIENKDKATVRDLGRQAITLIDAIERRCSPLTPDQTHRLGDHTQHRLRPARDRAVRSGDPPVRAHDRVSCSVRLDLPLSRRRCLGDDRRPRPSPRTAASGQRPAPFPQPLAGSTTREPAS